MDDLTASKLQNAYELIKAGKRAQAREILIPLARANPDLGDVWLLLGHAASDPPEKIRCFQQVLRLEPGSQQAKNQLCRLLAQQVVSQKKQKPAFVWGLAALASLFICFSGFGIFWSINQPLFSRPAPTAPGSSTPINLPAVPLAAATSTPRFSPTPKPTFRPTFTLPPSQTPQPSVTILPSITITFTISPSPTIGPKPKPSSGCAVPNGLGPLTAPFKIENFGKAGSTVYIKGVSKNGDHPILCQVIVKRGKPVTLTLMLGNFEYTVFRGSTIRTGTFFINKPDKSTMRIFDDKIQIGPFE